MLAVEANRETPKSQIRASAVPSVRWCTRPTFGCTTLRSRRPSCRNRPAHTVRLGGQVLAKHLDGDVGPGRIVRTALHPGAEDLTHGAATQALCEHVP